MSGTLALTLMGITILDSLNPSLFFAQFYLLTTPRPALRVLTYIAGVLTVNALGDWLILNNARSVIAEFLASINPQVLTVIQIILGIAILVFGLWYQAKPAADDEKKPESLHPLYTFGFGMLVMLNEITTALPYFVAIEQIAQQKLPLIGNLMALALYNAIFALPLVAFLVLFLLFQEWFARGIAAIRVWSRVWIPRIVKAVAVLFGFFLIIDGLL
jgi:cytochrome c biogenesis protein CcdA